MSLYQDIRAALITQAITASGFPAANLRAYDDQPYDPDINTVWARITFIPNNEAPWDVSAKLDMHRGLLQISLYGPTGAGTGTLDVVADAIRGVIRPGDNLFSNSVRVSIERIQRGRAVPVENGAWLMLPVTIYWRCVAAL